MLTGCDEPGTVTEQGWGALPSGEAVSLYTLTNANGMQAEITNYGGIVVSLTAPDRDGNFEDVVLGYHTLDEYVARNPLFGALVGLYANRIETGLIELDGGAVVCSRATRPSPGSYARWFRRSGSGCLGGRLWGEAQSGVSGIELPA